MATKATKEAKPPVVEGAAVDLGDSAKALYRDKAGGKLGGGPSEGASYKGVVAEQAIESVRVANLPPKDAA